VLSAEKYDEKYAKDTAEKNETSQAMS